MTDNERAELIERQYAFLAEQEAAAAQQIDPNLETSAEPPAESPQARWEREGLEQAARERQARAELRRRQAAILNEHRASPVDWDARIDAAVAEERGYVMKVLEATIAELEARALARLEDHLRPLHVEIAQLKVSNAKLELTNTNLRAQLINNGHADSAGTLSALN